MDETVRVWNPTTGECLQVLAGHTHGVRSLVVLPDGRLASGSWDNTICVWKQQQDLSIAQVKEELARRQRVKAQEKLARTRKLSRLGVYSATAAAMFSVLYNKFL